MNGYIKKYADASGANRKDSAEFNSLNSKIPALSADYSKAVMQVKNGLYKNGFSYAPRTFTLQDVLRANGGNCLGLPLLAGAILGERGFIPAFNIVTNPRDATFKLESVFFNRIKDEMSLREPDLSVQREELPLYRFVPLEHLALRVDDGLVEMTSPENELFEGESSFSLDFNEALSYVCKDRAVRFIQAGNHSMAKDILKRGFVYWRDNPNIHSLMAALAKDLGDNKLYAEHLEEFKRLFHDNSLYNYELYLLTKEISYLNIALEKYPSFASAIAEKAHIITNRDSSQAKALFALASRCWANSNILDFTQFDSTYRRELSYLFGKTPLPSHYTKV